MERTSTSHPILLLAHTSDLDLVILASVFCCCGSSLPTIAWGPGLLPCGLPPWVFCSLLPWADSPAGLWGGFPAPAALSAFALRCASCKHKHPLWIDQYSAKDQPMRGLLSTPSQKWKCSYILLSCLYFVGSWMWWTTQQSTHRSLQQIYCSWHTTINTIKT